MLNRIISVEYQYLQPFNCVQTNVLWLILKMLPINYSLKNHAYKNKILH